MITTLYILASLEKFNIKLSGAEDLEHWCRTFAVKVTNLQHVQFALLEIILKLIVLRILSVR